jgi:putative two-component system response regulator
VDDREINRVVLRSIFEGSYNLLEAENGQQGMLLIHQYHERLAAILLDIVMPVMDGYQVMEEAGRRGYLQEIPVAVITAESSAENEVRVFDLGASEIIAKPFEPHVVRRRVQNIIDLNLRKLHQDELIEQQAAKIRESNAVMIDALSSIIEYRSLETGQHIQRISLFTRTLLEDVAKNYPEYLLDEHKVGIIASASSLHDIGKIAIPDAVLNKPGRLTPAEYELMKTHAAKGAEMLTNLQRMGDQEYLRYAYNICRYHHERWDGRGYPDGLRGDAIPICAQVVGIADCYDALTNDRVYKKAIPSSQAVNMILNGECGVFSPRLLESLKNVQTTFSHLTEEYIDTAPAVTHRPPETLSRAAGETDPLNTQQMAQMKYYTLLRQLDSTVMEVDFTTGLYHVVYLAGESFELLRSGATFEESFRRFIGSSVAPEDRARVMEALSGDYVTALFREGLMKRTREYRVYSPSAREYVPCQATLLRIDTEVPHQRKALVIWRQESVRVSERSSEWDADARRRLLQSAIGSVQSCLLDRWFTLDAPVDGLETFLGYDAGEIASRFKNRYLDLIYPADRGEVFHQLREQLSHRELVELEYRLTAKDGRVLWVLDKSLCLTGEDGEQHCHFALIDITQSRQAQQDLRLLSERYRLLMEQIDDIIFEWDPRSDILEVSPNWITEFGYPAIRTDASRQLTQASHLHPNDIPKIAEAFQSIRGGKPCREEELRIADKEGRYRWCKIRTALQYGEAGELLRVIGVASNIDAEKRAAQILRDEAEHDSLTTLYNRSAATQKIEAMIASLHSGERAAMVLFDLDGFKQVNDHFGHLYGDEILKSAAAEFRRLASPGDVVARVGGDEFLIFTRNVPDGQTVALRAGQTIQALRDTFCRMMQRHQPSCSAGIALCPQDGATFSELFRRGDIALYRAKAGGKNRAEIYDQAVMGSDFAPSLQPIAATTRIDSELSSPLGERGPEA